MQEEPGSGHEDGPRRSGERQGSPSPAPVQHITPSITLKGTNLDLKTLLTRSGGAYIPPAKLAALQAEALANASALSEADRAAHTQRLTWDALRRSINGLVNKLNTSNIKHIIPEVFEENLIRGRGLLCRVLMKAQAVALPYTPVYAAMIAVINTKFPQIGELLVVRLLAQFRRAWKRGDKGVCVTVVKFLAHLVNHKVVHDLLALQILLLLLSKPTDDGVEVAVGMIREVGSFLQLESRRALDAVFERLRSILHEGTGIDKRTMYMVEVLFQERKEGFASQPAIPADLDLVEEADQITHTLQLTSPLDTQDMLNVFRVDPHYEDNERAYRRMKAEILGLEEEEGESGSEAESGDEEEDGGDGSDHEEDGDEEAKAAAEAAIERAHQAMIIQDQTNTNLLNLRRAIYLIIMSSLNFEECAHKLLKLDIAPGQEIEVVNMIVECCSQERTFVSFYGFLAERFARRHLQWRQAFEAAFEEVFKTIHRFETNRLRNIANLFAYILAVDAISWRVWALVRITEADTTSSSRIFLKIMLGKLVEVMGLAKLKERMCRQVMVPEHRQRALASGRATSFGAAPGQDADLIITLDTPQGWVNQSVFEGCFPKDDPRNTRFAINYFTSIGLGALTEDLRDFLKQQTAARLEAAAAAAAAREQEEEEAMRRDEGGAGTDGYGSEASYERGRPRHRDASYSPARSYVSSVSASPGRLRRHGGGHERSPSPGASPYRPARPSTRHRSRSRSSSAPRGRRGRSRSRSMSRPRPTRREGRSRSYTTSPRGDSRGRGPRLSESPASPHPRRAPRHLSPASPSPRRRSSEARGRSLSPSRSPSPRRRSPSPPPRGHARHGLASKVREYRSRSRSGSPPPPHPAQFRKRSLASHASSPAPAPLSRRSREGWEEDRTRPLSPFSQRRLMSEGGRNAPPLSGRVGNVTWTAGPGARPGPGVRDRDPDPRTQPRGRRTPASPRREESVSPYTRRVLMSQGRWPPSANDPGMRKRSPSPAAAGSADKRLRS